jgi:hypothetical protein
MCLVLWKSNVKWIVTIMLVVMTSTIRFGDHSAGYEKDRLWITAENPRVSEDRIRKKLAATT